MTKYKIAVLEDDDVLREVIVESLRFRDFEAAGYDEAERLLADVFDTPLGPEAMPDVVVIDMLLKQEKMQGLTLVAVLADRDVPCEMLVMSGYMPGADLVEAVSMGAGAWIAKPFGIFDLIRVIEKVSETGRKRRFYRLGDHQGNRDMDPSRVQRPVFLSYSTKDKKLATGLRRNLEAKDLPVWYAPTTVDLGDAWRSRIAQGVDQ